MRESLEQRSLAVAGWGEHEGDLSGAKGAGDVLEHLEVLDRVAGVRLGGRAQGAGDASDRGERRAGEHLGHGDDGSVHLAGGQLEGVAQVALDLNLGQLAIGLGLGLEHGDVIAELVALQRSHGSDWLNLRPSTRPDFLTMRHRPARVRTFAANASRRFDCTDARIEPGALGLSAARCEGGAGTARRQRT